VFREDAHKGLEHVEEENDEGRAAKPGLPAKSPKGWCVWWL